MNKDDVIQLVKAIISELVEIKFFEKDIICVQKLYLLKESNRMEIPKDWNLIKDGICQKGDIVMSGTYVKLAQGLIGSQIEYGECCGLKVYRKPDKGKDKVK